MNNTYTATARVYIVAEPVTFRSPFVQKKHLETKTILACYAEIFILKLLGFSLIRLHFTDDELEWLPRVVRRWYGSASIRNNQIYVCVTMQTKSKN